MLDDDQQYCLKDDELKLFFDRLFPHGIVGPDVLAELAPDGWERSPLLACFHPSPEQVLQEKLQWYRDPNDTDSLSRDKTPDDSEDEPKPKPTLESVLADWTEKPVDVTGEVTRLVGRCLWDVFVYMHEVLAADGRLVDLISFRKSGAFIASFVDGSLDEDVDEDSDDWWDHDFKRFYQSTSWLSGSEIGDYADLTPVYAMIFRRLKSVDADWVHHFPKMTVVGCGPDHGAETELGNYSPSEAFAREQAERERQEELEREQAKCEERYQQSCREAMDLPPPCTVRGYQEAFGHDPEGWPPA